MTAFASVHSPPIRVYYPLALFRSPAEEIGRTSPVRVYVPLRLETWQMGVALPLQALAFCLVVSASKSARGLVAPVVATPSAGRR